MAKSHVINSPLGQTPDLKLKDVALINKSTLYKLIFVHYYISTL
jgi:hypothetical protein